MALFKRGNIWWMEVTDPTGKKLRESTRTMDRGKAEKVQELKRMQMAMTPAPQGRQSESPPCRTWKEASERRLSEHDDKRSAKDDLRYARWWSSKLGSRRLDQVDADLLRGFLEEKRKESSASTSHRHLSFISAVLNAAVREYGRISSTPYLRRYKEPKGVVRYLTSTESTGCSRSFLNINEAWLSLHWRLG